MSIKEVSPGIFIANNSIIQFASSSSQKNVVAGPTEVILKLSDPIKADKINIAPWGSDNLEPQNILKKINDIGVAGRGIEVRIGAHFGTGVALYEEDENGNRKKVPYKKVPKLHEFDKKNYLNLIALELISDLEPLHLGFIEFVLSRDFKTINRAKRHQSAFCRFEVMNEKTGRIERVALNSNWNDPDHKFTKIIPCFSMYEYFEDIQNYCRENKIYNFIIPYYYPRNNEIYYNKPKWVAPLKNGWADVVLSIPELKNAIAKNQLHFKYVIHVLEKYFEITYGSDDSGAPAWHGFSPDEKSKKKRELIDSINSHMSGPSAGGRSLTVPMYVGPDGKLEETIKIVPIDDKLKDGAYLPDASAGNTEILFAMGVDPSIVGVGIPGSSNLSGSGSDKREAYTILCANMTTSRTISLLPFYFLRDWNGWGENLDFGFPNVVLTTLDKEPSGQTETQH